MIPQDLKHKLAFLVRGTHGGVGPLRTMIAVTNAGWLSVIAALGLCLAGVLAIDLSQNPEPAGTLDLASHAIKQGIYIAVGIGAALIILIPHHRLIALLAVPGMLLCIGLLVFLLIPFVPDAIVTPRQGARGWINLGIADFQPAEVTKIAYVLVVASYLRFRRAHRRFVGLIVPGLITAVPAGLITLQPDLGTASLFAPSLFAMLVAAGARLRHLIIIVVVAAAALPAAYPLMKPHQKVRIQGLLQQIQGNRENADSINYQSFVAQRLVAAGGLAGVSDPKARAIIRYNHLPEAHNDMIYAVITLRWGLVGGLVVVGLHGLWILGALLTAASCRDPFGRLVVVGLAGFVAAQVIINVGMTIGLMPIIGITMPFVSYGGSSMLTSWLMTGLVLNVACRRAEPPFRDSFEYADHE